MDYGKTTMSSEAMYHAASVTTEREYFQPLDISASMGIWTQEQGYLHPFSGSVCNVPPELRELPAETGCIERAQWLMSQGTHANDATTPLLA